MNRRIEVRTQAAYDVVVGRNLNSHIGETTTATGADRVAIIHPSVLAEPARQLRSQLSVGHTEIHLISLPDGEDAKTAEVSQFCWNVLADAGFTRSDLIIGLGGGTTTDVAGFVAATWLRGVQFVTVPTTLLGMVDAAVGGKTGINMAHGKNLVGAFHEPTAVACDLNFLRTLPAREIRSGMAEVLKCGFIADGSILDDFERDPAMAMDPGTDLLADLIVRGIAVKAAVVASDLKETGQSDPESQDPSSVDASGPSQDNPSGSSIGREALNYGHTLGHAIESFEQYQGLRHGEAISIGMVFAAELAYRLGGIDGDLLQRHRRVLSAAGLPTSYSFDAWDQLAPIMSLDKKARGSKLRFVVLQRQRPTSLVHSQDNPPGRTRPVIIESPEADLLADCYASVASQ